MALTNQGHRAEVPNDRGPVLSVADLHKRFRLVSRTGSRKPVWLRAVDGVSFHIDPGETWGLVGESGSGKSTTARLVLRLLEPDEGSIVFDHQDITKLRGRSLRPLRRSMQAVFQDVSGSLDPHMTIQRIVEEPLGIYSDDTSADRRAAVKEMLELVGISGAQLGRYPYELSGGQRQRVSLARAMILRPKLLVLDEPTSALDVSTRARIIGLLQRLQEFGAAFFVVAHDLDFVHHLCDRIAVMYLGQIVEMGNAAQVYSRPRHPYSEALLDAMPKVRTTGPQSANRLIVSDDVPSPTNVPPGCRFHTRCPYVWDRCRVEIPVLQHFNDGGSVACHLHDDGPQLAGTSVRVMATRNGSSAAIAT